MTQKEKQLLIKDLCARLPYYTIVLMGDGGIEPLISVNVDTGICNGLKGLPKPYLRPMSSITEEEKEELKQEHVKDEKLYAECLTKAANGDNSMRGKVIPHFAADWCNKNHFDYRGLIPMGLALEAPEGMYKNE